MINKIKHFFWDTTLGLFLLLLFAIFILLVIFFQPLPASAQSLPNGNSYVEVIFSNDPPASPYFVAFLPTFEDFCKDSAAGTTTNNSFVQTKIFGEISGYVTDASGIGSNYDFACAYMSQGSEVVSLNYVMTEQDSLPAQNYSLIFYSQIPDEAFLELTYYYDPGSPPVPDVPSSFSLTISNPVDNSHVSPSIIASGTYNTSYEDTSVFLELYDRTTEAMPRQFSIDVDTGSGTWSKEINLNINREYTLYARLESPEEVSEWVEVSFDTSTAFLNDIEIWYPLENEKVSNIFNLNGVYNALTAGFTPDSVSYEIYDNTNTLVLSGSTFANIYANDVRWGDVVTLEDVGNYKVRASLYNSQTTERSDWTSYRNFQIASDCDSLDVWCKFVNWFNTMWLNIQTSVKNGIQNLFANLFNAENYFPYNYYTQLVNAFANIDFENGAVDWDFTAETSELEILNGVKFFGQDELFAFVDEDLEMKIKNIIDIILWVAFALGWGLVIRYEVRNLRSLFT